ncbi:methylated-DNA--[protein]-cysteine S-methyltransferase [Methanomicrobium antiquum]|uniref:Methylated-DNA--[protein]-cysteine S-methyltransferase n=1 Tax=Methanomicrobium antiquum TaxID=487686 RepID=A0AAF0FNJ5_9EURY|nr:methylated-DNA--[protein]-cysteine S-methyltransferase [Methanomicrobium antiquum]WFN35849.1 methylated-DNA--[protein]-cysteine S-methyltransferase [Methanomicrobium antiquum]
MEIRSGVCRFGLWRIRILWSENLVHKVSFERFGEESYVPPQIKLFLSGKKDTLSPLTSVALTDGHPYNNIYRAVFEIPYGETKTYSEVAEICGTHHRTVGIAMKRNPTPLIIPCHRVVSKNSLGGFTPDIMIKKSLLEIEKKKRNLAGLS